MMNGTVSEFFSDAIYNHDDDDAIDDDDNESKNRSCTELRYECGYMLKYMRSLLITNIANIFILFYLLIFFFFLNYIFYLLIFFVDLVFFQLQLKRLFHIACYMKLAAHKEDAAPHFKRSESTHDAHSSTSYMRL